MSKSRRWMRLEIVIPNSYQLAKGLGVDEQGDVQRYFTRQVFERLEPYLPKKEGDLRASGEIIGNSLIQYSTPYTRAQFFGVTREGVPFKYKPTGEKVGAHWDRRLAADEGEQILEDVRQYMRSRGYRK